MARKKVKLAYVANDSARKATFKKRKKGLMKKVSELSTLCGVEACAIVYGLHDTQPDSWPEGPEAQRIIEKFKSMPEMEQSKKMMNQEGFLRQRITKLREQLKKQERDNREAEMTMLMNQALAGKSINDFHLADLSDLAWAIDVKLKEIGERIEVLRGSTTISVDGLVKVSDKDVTMEDSLKNLQSQTWFIDAMNPDEQIICPSDMVIQYPEINPWLNPYYGYEKL